MIFPLKTERKMYGSLCLSGCLGVFSRVFFAVSGPIVSFENRKDAPGLYKMFLQSCFAKSEVRAFLYFRLDASILVSAAEDQKGAQHSTHVDFDSSSDNNDNNKLWIAQPTLADY